MIKASLPNEAFRARSVIVYGPLCRYIVKSIPASLIFATIMSNMNKKGIVYLSRKDIQYFTGLSDRQYRTAMKNLENIFCLECYYKQKMKLTYFKVSLDILKIETEEFLKEYQWKYRSKP